MKHRNIAVVGIDPGSRILGWGVVEACGSKIAYVSHGIIKPKRADRMRRIVDICDGLQDIFSRLTPFVLAIETAFVGRNIHTALVLGEVRGACIATASFAIHGERPCDIREYTPRQVKQSVTGSGAASKDSVRYMARQILGIPDDNMPDDAWDALAVAIACANEIRARKITMEI